MAYGIKFSSKISYSAQGLQSIRNMLKGNQEWLELEFTDLAKKISKGIISHIDSKTGSRDNRGGGLGLATAFRNYVVTRKGSQFTIGIGNKGDLNKFFPYWYALNYGKFYKSGKPFIPPPTIGYFDGTTRPIPGVGGQRWEYDNQATQRFYMEPKKAVPGIMYIQKGNDILKKGTAQIMTKLKRRNAKGK